MAGAPVRVIDTGLRTGRANVAFDQALIEARGAGLIPDTIRFLRFRPSALVGIHQILGHEVRIDYCRQHGIEIGRRITGGGGLYLDEGQIGWELVLDRRRFAGLDLGAIAARICEAAAAGLRALGVAAEFRPRNDIEIGGRKVSGTGGFVDGNTLFFQGTLLIDFDPAAMIEALKVPVEKLARRDLDDARQRVISLREALGRMPPLDEVYAALLAGFRDHLGLAPAWGAVTADEEALAARLYESEFGTDDFVHMLDAPDADDTLVSASLARRGGSMRADIRLEGPNRDRMREVLITGDFFLAPPRARFDLEAALRGLNVADAGRAVEAFFAAADCELIGLVPADFRDVVEAALGQLTFRAAGRTLRGHWRGKRPTDAADAPATLVFLHDALGCTRTWRDVPEKLAQATGRGAFVYDRWGSGDSEPMAPPYARDYMRREALDSFPEVLAQAGLRDAILVGQSDGAAIALAFAGAHPDRVRGVIALSPHLFVEAKTLKAIGDQIADFETGDLKARLARHHGNRTEALFARLVEVWTGQGAGGRWGLDALAAAVRCPVLAIQGEDDEFFSAAQLDTLAALLPGRLQTLRIPGCGHYPHLQARPEMLAASIRFVQGLSAAAAAERAHFATHSSPTLR